MSKSEFDKLRNEVRTLKKELRRLRAYGDETTYGDMTTPPGVPTYYAVVTDVQIDTATLKFQKKTVNAVVNATATESGWTDWHTGTVCPTTISTAENTEAVSGENVSAAAPTMALLRFTGAI